MFWRKDRNGTSAWRGGNNMTGAMSAEYTPTLVRSCMFHMFHKWILFKQLVQGDHPGGCCHELLHPWGNSSSVNEKNLRLTGKNAEFMKNKTIYQFYFWICSNERKCCPPAANSFEEINRFSEKGDVVLWGYITTWRSKWRRQLRRSISNKPNLNLHNLPFIHKDLISFMMQSKARIHGHHIWRSQIWSSQLIPKTQGSLPGVTGDNCRAVGVSIHSSSYLKIPSFPQGWYIKPYRLYPPQKNNEMKWSPVLQRDSVCQKEMFFIFLHHWFSGDLSVFGEFFHIDRGRDYFDKRLDLLKHVEEGGKVSSVYHMCTV